MPVVSRARTVPAIPQRLWSLVADPDSLPRWWPGVTRVEEVSERGWTTVLQAPKGRTLRADYTLVSSDHPQRLRWRQEIEESPFERIMSLAVTTIDLEPADESSTEVRITAEIRLRGLSRFGGLQMGLATRRRLDSALDSLAELADGWRESER